LPIATLVVAPTIVRLAAVIVGEGKEGAQPNLVSMRAGRGRPLFMLHSITGSIMECLTLAGTLQSDRPVYGLQARGLDGDDAPQRRVEDMARVYIEQMRMVQPSGPYALVGYSFGGLVAFEIAQQLIAAGEKIELLCLLDTYVNERYLPLAARTRFQLGVVSNRVSEFRALSGRDRASYLRDRAFGLADRIRMRAGLLARKAAPDTEGLPPVLKHVRESMRVAMTTYRPRRYRGGPIIYVRASIKEGGQGDPLPAWQQIARRGLIVKHLEGRHTDLVIEPNLAAVADEIARGLAVEG
jgi:acetoacetyl-CoA synthetase